MGIKNREFDVLVLILLLALSVVYAFITKDLFIGKPLFGLLAFTVPPIVYLGLRKEKNWKKIFVFTLVFGALFGSIFEFFIEFNNVYHVTSPVFPFRFLGVLYLDHIFAHALMAMLTVTFYEHFIDREIHGKISNHLKFAVIPAILSGVVLIVLFFLNKGFLEVKYPYFFAGIAATIFPIYLGFKKPEFVKNMAETAIYFFFLWFVAELVAVSLNYWFYPGNNYIGWVTIFGISFPFEELFFWILFYAAILVSFYELFIDDHSQIPHPHVK